MGHLFLCPATWRVPCQGDSGGPLMTAGTERSGGSGPGQVWSQAGIVSFGSSAGCEVTISPWNSRSFQVFKLRKEASNILKCSFLPFQNFLCRSNFSHCINHYIVFCFEDRLAKWIHQSGILFELDPRRDWTGNIMGQSTIFLYLLELLTKPYIFLLKRNIFLKAL